MVITPLESQTLYHIQDIENNTWVRGDIKFIFECSSRDIELEYKKINSYLQASMYYFVYYINISLKSREKKSWKSLID
jgi:hypothetical protein